MWASSNRSFFSIVEDPRVVGCGWGGRHAGGGFPAHGVYSSVRNQRSGPHAFGYRSTQYDGVIRSLIERFRRLSQQGRKTQTIFIVNQEKQSFYVFVFPLLGRVSSGFFGNRSGGGGNSEYLGVGQVSLYLFWSLEHVVGGNGCSYEVLVGVDERTSNQNDGK